LRKGAKLQQYFAGTHLNPNVTWWEKSAPFFAYINRCQSLLQQGLPVADVSSNLESLVRLGKDAGAKILLIGMRIPPNYGPAYTTSFHDMYGVVAARERVALVPFFLDGIALDEGLMQDDGLHPNSEAQPKLLDQVWPRLLPLLKK